MPLLQIAYFSTATQPQTAEVLSKILINARARNARDSITGLLVAGGNRYMQVIEGFEAPMLALWSAIRADERHCAIARLLKRSVSSRSFEGWSMAFRMQDGSAAYDSFPQTLKLLTTQVEDAALRRQIELFARSFILTLHDRASQSAWGNVA